MFDNAKTIYVYTPDAPIAKLPEGLISYEPHMIDTSAEKLDRYAVYNPDTQIGMVPYDEKHGYDLKTRETQ